MKLKCKIFGHKYILKERHSISVFTIDYYYRCKRCNDFTWRTLTLGFQDNWYQTWGPVIRGPVNIND